MPFKRILKLTKIPSLGLQKYQCFHLGISSPPASPTSFPLGIFGKSPSVFFRAAETHPAAGGVPERRGGDQERRTWATAIIIIVVGVGVDFPALPPNSLALSFCTLRLSTIPTALLDPFWRGGEGLLKRMGDLLRPPQKDGGGKPAAAAKGRL